MSTTEPELTQRLPGAGVTAVTAGTIGTDLARAVPSVPVPG